MRPLRLALIRARYNPFGGAERFVANTLQALQSQDVKLTIVTRSWQEQPAVEALVINPFYVGNVWRDWSFARAVCTTLKRQSFDLVQSHERIACCDVYRAGDGVHREWLAQRQRAQGLSGRVAVALNPYHHYMLRAERRLFESPKLQAVICISQMVKEEIRRYFGVPETRCHVVYNGVDSERFSPRLRVTHRQAFRQQHGIDKKAVVYLFVGSGFERKGVGRLLSALATLPADCHGLVVGTDKHRHRYENWSRGLGLAGRVHFTGGLQDTAPAYGAADVFVLPTLYEPFGNAALEAMASGLPVVTSTKCGAGELIQDGVNGYRCDALELATLARCMAFLRDPVRRKDMGEAARLAALPLTFEVMSTRLLDLYQSLLQQKR